MGKGGYLIYMKTAKISYVFGETVSPFVEYRSQNVLEFITAKYQKMAEPIVEIAALPAVEPVAQ
jgi:hypothetical protein